MSRDFPESDWKLLRDMSRIALDRLCERILNNVVRLASDPDNGAHTRYLAVWERIQKDNKEIAVAFDGLCRSTAIMQLAQMRRLNLITDAEFARFTDKTRQFVNRFLSLSQ